MFVGTFHLISPLLTCHCDLNYIVSEISPEEVGEGVIWEVLLSESKVLCSTYIKIKGICSLKALKHKSILGRALYRVPCPITGSAV